MRRKRRTHLMRFIALMVVVVAVGGYFGFYSPVWDDINKGLDLVGGIHIVLEAQDTETTPVTEEGMTSAVEVIRRRVDAMGVVEPVIVREGDRRIVVSLPDVHDPEEAMAMVGRTAQLEFRDDDGNVVLTGRHLERAQAVFQTTEMGAQEPIVSLEFDAEGTEILAEATEELLGERMVIYLDDEVVQAPVVRSVITDGSPIIEGYDSLEEAQEIAVVLNSGALPIELEPLRPQYISAMLGEASVQQSWQAAIIAITAIISLMILFYRVPGIWAVFSLGLYLTLVLLIMAGINATMTLPGLAGLILSLGMAVDANVIIFERIKEEVRAGATPRAAIESGFANAFRTIVDADVTTLIAGVVLYWLATGPIRGFAVTLSLGILTSMFTALVITRLALIELAGAGLIREGSLFFGSRGGQ